MGFKEAIEIDHQKQWKLTTTNHRNQPLGATEINHQKPWKSITVDEIKYH